MKNEQEQMKKKSKIIYFNKEKEPRRSSNENESN